MKKLIIAEKPSVAKTIAAVVDAREQHDGYMEGDNYVVSWCFGHLMENAPPDAYDEGLKKWRIETLPIVPANWLAQPIADARSKAQLKVLGKLMARKDIGSFIEATDAGREGELIFRLVYEYEGCGKPFERLWISSLEASAIKAGMASLKPSTEYDNLYQAALARSRADWLFGINGTRFYTIAGCMGEDKATVGRVQTPTLAMIVARQREIENFKVEKRYAVVADFGDWKLETEKFNAEGDAKACQAACDGKPMEITDVVSQKKQTGAPRLFSLTSLQREMNRRFGFSADHTLKLIQGLYERKILSYPRTDAEYITSDMKDTFLRIVSNIGAARNVVPDKAGVSKVIDDKKVSDHYAVIATELYSRSMDKTELTRDEQCVVNVIVQRMFEAIAPQYVYMSTAVTGKVGEYEYKGTGAVPVSMGWKGVAKAFRADQGQEEKMSALSNNFPKGIAAGQKYTPQSYSIASRDTKPPSYYTEDTLLGAMEKAGAKEMDDDVERKGLGTSATRAEIIEKLVRRGYIVKEKKLIKATPEGCHLIDSVAEGFKSVSTTVEWENRLLEIERGRSSLTCDTFCQGITDELKKLIANAGTDLAMQVGPVGSCPWCGKDMTVTRGVARCECGKRIWLTPHWMKKGKSFTKDQMGSLLKGKTVKGTLVSKAGKEYEVMAAIDFEKTRGSDYVEWKFQFGDGAKAEGGGPVGKCPVCGGDANLADGVVTCAGCGRKLYSGARWMPDGKAFTKEDLEKLFSGGAVRAKLKSKAGKVYNVNASIDLEKSIASEKYYDYHFDFLK